MKKPKKTSLVAPLIVEPEDLDHNPAEVTPISPKKRMPSQAYRQSARNSQKLILELEKMRQNSGFEYQHCNLHPNGTGDSNQANKNPNTLTPIEKLTKIGWKTIICTVFLITFSIGVLIGTLVSINKLPRQGFYLFLVIGLLVLFPATYASYHVLGKYFGWIKDESEAQEENRPSVTV